MELVELTDKNDMLNQLAILNELYPNLTKAQYSEELNFMLKHNYGQVAVFKDGEAIALTGYWFGNKLWCGKYIEIDNIVVKEKYRSTGAGALLVDYIKQKALKLDCNMVSLDSYVNNYKAHKFFYNHQFAPRGFHFIQVIKEENIR